MATLAIMGRAAFPREAAGALRPDAARQLGVRVGPCAGQRIGLAPSAAEGAFEAPVPASVITWM